MERSRLRRRRKRDILAFFSGLVVIVLIISFIALYSKSKNPEFCMSCHYEKPYYHNWKTSDHNFVDCYKCHMDIPWKMPLFVFKYALGLYDMYPRSNVPSSACLQEGCHSKKELFSEKLVIKDKPVFNHKQHLSSPLRGIELRCSSCHSHIVQGEKHVTVETSVCFICHFMGAGKGQSITGCPSCHGTPKKVVEYHGFKFRHDEYLKIGVSCDQCHVDIVRGTGEVPDSRCHRCHVAREKPDNPKIVHDIHVKKEGIDCYICHTQIEHGNVKLVKTFRVECNDCHLNLHSLQKAMYMGVGGLGMGDLPSRMFAAQVTCEGCHTKNKVVGYGDEVTKFASAVSCVECHEEGYDKMLGDWKSNLGSLLSYVGSRIKKAKLLKRYMNDDLKRLLDEAEYNYRFVLSANGVHNVEYAVKLLKISVDNLDKIYSSLNRRAPQRPKIIARPDGYCTSMCHTRLGMPEEVYFEQKYVFPHQVHTKNNIACMRCHSVERHGLTLLKYADCLKCHHQMEEASDLCSKCHRQERDFYFARVKGLPAGEPNPMGSDVSCTDCHDVTETISVTYEQVRNMCIECHDGDTSYGDALDEWKEQVEEIRDKINKYYKEITALLQQKKLSPEGERLVRKHYSVLIRIRKIINKSNLAIHNPDYAQQLMDIAEKSYNKLRAILL